MITSTQNLIDTSIQLGRMHLKYMSDPLISKMHDESAVSGSALV